MCLGCRKTIMTSKTIARNPSLDFSVLHVLSKNPQLFSDIHDNSLMLALTRALPKKFRSTNIQMLSAEEEARIEECFRRRKPLATEDLLLRDRRGSYLPDVFHAAKS